jgi:drug/metabolite transporter (DMT)-like permease
MNYIISIIVAIIGWLILDNTNSKPGDLLGMALFVGGLLSMLWCWLTSDHSVEGNSDDWRN